MSIAVAIYSSSFRRFAYGHDDEGRLNDEPCGVDSRSLFDADSRSLQRAKCEVRKSRASRVFSSLFTLMTSKR